MDLISGFERFPRARAQLARGLREGVFPGCVAGIWSRRDSVNDHVAWGGSRRLRGKGFPVQPVESDTIFDLASVSKVFGTGALAMALVERGWITWDTPVRAILPQFPDGAVTLRDLASHVSGLPAWAPFYERMRESFGTDELERISVEERQSAMRELVLAVDLESPLRTKMVYSDIGFLILGFCLEAVADLALDRAVERFVWRPMGLYDGERAHPRYVRTTEAAFHARDENVAATEDSPWRRAILQGQVHDDNCWAMGGYGGHAGTFGDARTLLRFGRKLLDGYFSPAVTRAAWSRVSEPTGCGRTPGWDTPGGDCPAFGKIFSDRSIGHLGFTGTSFWIDPIHEVVVVLLTNRVHPTRENHRIRPFRGLFHDALAQDFFDL